MTTDQYYQLLRETNDQILAAAKRAYDSLVEKIKSGVPAQLAVQQVTEQFSREYTEILAAGIAAVKELSDIPATVEAGGIMLSSRLYANAQATSRVVEGIVDEHRKGLQDARALALELYEGYGFKPVEPLVIAPGNDALPQYLRRALLPDPGVARDLARAFARAQATALRTGALRAAYTELLASLDAIESGSGAAFLEKKLQVAFEEKMRYFAKRIAETELHRAFAIEQAAELMADTDVIFVQYRMSPAHPVEDICDYFAGVDRYGLGPGVYPKLAAPVAPAHPFCKCVLSPRLDLKEKPVTDREEADLAYFRRLSPVEQRKVAGSQAKLDRILAGQSAWSVHNARIDPMYQVKTVGMVAG